MPKNIENDLTAWIDLKDFEQCRWAFQYLLKQEWYSNMSVIFLDDHAWLSHYLEEFKETLTESSDNKILMKRMKGAWRQRMDRQSRKKRKKNSYSFVIGMGFSRQLTTLAKEREQPRNAMLECLIEDAYNNLKWNKLELKKQKQKFKEKEIKYKKQINDRSEYVSPALLDRAETKIKTLEEENDKLKKELEKSKACLDKVRPKNQIEQKPRKKIILSRNKKTKENESERKSVNVEVRKNKT